MTFATCAYTRLPQSPASALISDGVNENPNLTDNWDDAEGYYRKSVEVPYICTIQSGIQNCMGYPFNLGKALNLLMYSCRDMVWWALIRIPRTLLLILQVFVLVSSWTDGTQYTGILGKGYLAMWCVPGTHSRETWR